jgi:hypothetical protein
MEVFTRPTAQAAFTPRQLSYALKDYAANGPSLDYGNGRVAAIYEFPGGLFDHRGGGLPAGAVYNRRCL